VRRDERLSLPEKVAKSVAESAPVVVVLASPREIPLHAIESPFATPVIRLTLLLKVVQSIQVIAPVVVEFAIFIPNTPVRLLYVTGPFAERDVREILVATTHERVFTVVERVFTEPERLNTVHERERKLVASVLTLPERLKRVPERVRIFPVAVARVLWSARIFPVAVAR